MFRNGHYDLVSAHVEIDSSELEDRISTFESRLDELENREHAYTGDIGELITESEARMRLWSSNAFAKSEAHAALEDRLQELERHHFDERVGGMSVYLADVAARVGALERTRLVLPPFVERVLRMLRG